MGSDDLDLVTVLETSDTFALSLAKSALEDAGINYLVSGDDPRYSSIYDGAVGAPGIGKPLYGNAPVQFGSGVNPKRKRVPCWSPLRIPPLRRVAWNRERIRKSSTVTPHIIL